MTTTLTNALNSLKTCSFCSDVCNVGAKGVTWLSESASKLRVSGGETLSKVASSVSAFFSSGAAKFGALLRSGRDLAVTAFGKCKESFKALPKEAKIGGGIALAAGVLALLYFRTPEKKLAETQEDAVVNDVALRDAEPAAKNAVQDTNAQRATSPVADSDESGDEIDADALANNAQPPVNANVVSNAQVEEVPANADVGADALDAVADAPKE